MPLKVRGEQQNPGHFANGHFAKMSQMGISLTFIFPALDKIDGVEYALTTIISQCSVKDATLAVIKGPSIILGYINLASYKLHKILKYN